jgi:ubiquinone biosynthesis protein
MPLSRTLRGYRNLQRLTQIINVFVKHGFGYFVVRLKLRRILPLRRRLAAAGKEPQAVTIPERVCLAFEELGPTFIKLGQILSSRPDLVPPLFVQEFKRLQDKVPPFPFEQVKETLERELGAPIAANFSSLSEVPDAAASIAQVHRATLLGGEPVIVKVQRPQIERTVEEDILLLQGLAQLLERHVVEMRSYNPTGIVSEFSRSIRRELDFTIEATNLERFQQNLKEAPSVVIPRVFWKLSTPRLLTLDRLEGIPIDEVEQIKQRGYNPQELARTLVDTYLLQIFEHGLFHADPHPGNILVLEGGRIGLLDFGIVGRIRPEIMQINASIFLALVDRDYGRLAEEILKLSQVTDESQIQAFRDDLIDWIEPRYGKDLAHIGIGRVVTEAIQIAHRYQIRMPSHLVLLAKTIGEIEAISRLLDPHLNLLEILKPHAKRFVRRLQSPYRILERILSSGEEYGELAEEFPSQIRQALRKLLHGKLRVEFSHVGLEHLSEEMDRSSNRISFSLIISGIIVGSSLIINLGRGPLIFGFSALGIIGFFLAGFLGLWLAIGILRSGRL